MNLLRLILICLVLVFVSCSKTKKSDEESFGDIAESEVSDGLEGIEDGEEFIEEGEEVTEESEALDENEVEDESVTEVMDEAKTASEEYANVEDQPSEAVSSGGMGEYVVEENDTLMWIAFKLYGDYLRWRDLARVNPGIEKSLDPGDKIQYEQLAEPFRWSPQGNPYLILDRDTLATISGKVYGTLGKWREIWENNSVMIKDPNLIFAGFTLYYLDADKLAAQ